MGGYFVVSGVTDYETDANMDECLKRAVKHMQFIDSLNRAGRVALETELEHFSDNPVWDGQITPIRAMRAALERFWERYIEYDID